MQVDQKKLVQRTRLFLTAVPFVLLVLIILRYSGDGESEDAPAPTPTRANLEQTVAEEIRRVLEARQLEKQLDEQEQPSSIWELLDPDARKRAEERERDPADLFGQRPQREQSENPLWPQAWPSPPAAQPEPQADVAKANRRDVKDFESVREVSALAVRFDIDIPPARDAPESSGGSEDPEAPAERVNNRTLLQGSLIPAILAEPANTDEPGLVTAYVQSDVYDSLTGTQLLIPAGARAIGRVAGLSDADTAAEIEWTRLILPDGRDLLVTASVTDPDGAGAHGRRKTRSLQKVGAVMTSAITAAAIQLAQRPQSTTTTGFFSPEQIAAEEASRDAGRVLDQWAQKKLSRPPTIILPIGATVRIKVEQDLEIPHNGSEQP